MADWKDARDTVLFVVACALVAVLLYKAVFYPERMF